MPKKLRITPELERVQNAIFDVSGSVRNAYSQLTESVNWRNHEKPFVERLNECTRKQLRTPRCVRDALEIIETIDEMLADIERNAEEGYFLYRLSRRSETLKLLCEVFIEMAAKER